MPTGLYRRFACAGVALADLARSPTRLQVDMTPVGKRIVPEAGEKEMALFDVKYKIYRESIEVQRRWRKMVDDVAGDEGRIAA